ncbi:MAG: hypothetical protein U1E87_08795 [Alphaproteobacteria bacterium]
MSIIALETDLSEASLRDPIRDTSPDRRSRGPRIEPCCASGRSSPSALFLTQEASVFVSRERARHPGLSLLHAPPDEETMQKLLDKLAFQAPPRSSASPSAWVRLARGAATDALEVLRFPAILKPATKDAEYAKRFRKAYQVTGAMEALDLWREISAVIPEVIVQEWIDGGDADVYFCLQYRPTSGVATSFVGRKLRQWPVLVGGTACCVPASEAATELTATTEKFSPQSGSSAFAAWSNNGTGATDASTWSGRRSGARIIRRRLPP